MILRPEDDEDMWHVYNLIAEVSYTPHMPTQLQASSERVQSTTVLTIFQGDEVQAMAIRRIQTVSSTGTSDSKRVRVALNLEVTKVGSYFPLHQVLLHMEHALGTVIWCQGKDWKRKKQILSTMLYDS